MHMVIVVVMVGAVTRFGPCLQILKWQSLTDHSAIFFQFYTVQEFQELVLVLQGILLPAFDGYPGRAQDQQSNQGISNPWHNWR